RVRFPLAMKVYPILHWILAGTGMLLFLSRLSASPAARWVGAVTYAFSGVAVSEFVYPHIQPGLALLPWVLWAISSSLSATLLVLSLSLFFALDLLAADVFTNALALLCAMLWIALEEETSRQKTLLGQLFLALVCAALATAPQIVATALWLPETS